MVGGAVFDLDGTLVDYDRSFEVSWTIKLLHDFGAKTGNKSLEEIEGAEVQRYLSLSILDREKKLLGWGYASARQFLNGWNTEQAFLEKMRFSYCYSDVPSLLRLAERKLKLGIVTSAPRNLADKELEMLSAVLGADLFPHRIYASHGSGIEMKPSPQGILLCLEEMGLPPREAIYVGNEDNDILAARNAGIKGVLIKRGRYHTTVEPSFEIASLGEILGLSFPLAS